MPGTAYLFDVVTIDVPQVFKDGENVDVYVYTCTYIHTQVVLRMEECIALLPGRPGSPCLPDGKWTTPQVFVGIEATVIRRTIIFKWRTSGWVAYLLDLGCHPYHLCQGHLEVRWKVWKTQHALLFCVLECASMLGTERRSKLWQHNLTCVCVCVCACVHAWMHACVCVCVIVIYSITTAP